MGKKRSTRKIAEPEKHPAARTLRAFIRAMNQWEQRLVDMDFRSMSDFRRRGAKLYDEGLRAIYTSFLEPGAAPERLTEPNWGAPDYNPRTEKIRSVKATRSKVIIETQMSGDYDFRMRYELIPVGEEWRLRGSRQCFDPDVRKWCYCEL